MKDRIREEARAALEAGWDGVLGLRQRWGHVGPYFFKDPAELGSMEVEPKYMLTRIIRSMLGKSSTLRIAAVVRGCDVRSIREMERVGGLDSQRLHLIGIECSQEQAAECNCEKPIYETVTCSGCWKCIEACKEGAIQKINTCPIVAPSEYNEGLSQRKSVYVPFAQAVPLKATRDAEHCIKIKGITDCKGCELTCLADAVKHDDKPAEREIQVGAVVMAPGFKPFDPTSIDMYGYGKLPNVVTAMEFERLLSASGPTMGHLARPSDHKEPKRIAWLQCVGSRNINQCDHEYCSGVCCMYAIKEAVIAKEHAKGGLDASIFFMDMRTHGKDFEKYYDRAREQHGVRFVRSRVHTIDPVPDTMGDLRIQYVSEEGEIQSESFDMVVLSVGLETPAGVKELAGRLDVKLNDNAFCEHSSFEPVTASRPGFFTCGAFQEPKDIPQSVVEASAAASAAGSLLASARGSLIREKVVPPQFNVVGERPRVGVFVCNCGINISGVVDVPAVREYAKTLPFVEYVADNLYTCSQDTQVAMKDVIKEHNLNRIVVAACTPRTHEPLFQETIIDAGLNKYLFEMANIRNHDSWVHANAPQLATKKAKDLVRMAVAKVALLEPLYDRELDLVPVTMVVGGGVAGMTAAKALADQGYEVHLVERSAELGGQAKNLHKTWRGESIQDYLKRLISDVESNPDIHVHTSTELAGVEGFVGNFTSELKPASGESIKLQHGLAILATGAREQRPHEYLYGEDPRVVTHLELDSRVIAGDPALERVGTAVFIQCVGSREADHPYCSRVCCTHSIESAIELKRRNPDTDVYVLYRDIRTYGEREGLYKEARKEGVIFIRYDLDSKPRVTAGSDAVRVEVFDPILGRSIAVKADLLVLASAIAPSESEELAQFFKVPLNEDGFFVEAHAKLRPVDFATEGVFLCGMAHGPKSMDESIAQAMAAASRATCLLAKAKVSVSGTVAATNQMLCSACGTCVSICPYSAPSFNDKGKAEINPALCKGCGLCTASCRSGAIRLQGFDDAQIFAMIESV